MLDVTHEAVTAAATAATIAAGAAVGAATEAHAVWDALTAVGQRGINRIWELTQAFIAVLVVSVTMYIAARDGKIPTELGVLAGSVLATYFTRTNHSAMGGVGPAQRRGE